MFGVHLQFRRTLFIQSLLLLASLTAAQPLAHDVYSALAHKTATAHTPSLDGHQTVIWLDETHPGDAESGFPGFRLEIQMVGENLFVLGLNSFTAGQLAQFVVSLSAFLDEAHALNNNQTLVLRQEGNRGYLALAANSEAGELQFTLTLHAEAPAEVTGDGGVHTLGLLIADQLPRPAE